jgi:uncharacterized protein with von Willebrand factor type A (vWA) domain
MPWDPTISLGHLITMGTVIGSGLIAFVKLSATVEAVKRDCERIRLEVKEDVDRLIEDYREQGKTLAGADKLMSTLSERVTEQLRQVDAAIKYNQTWRHSVANQFMKETGSRVVELEMAISKVDMRVISLEKRVDYIERRDGGC